MDQAWHPVHASQFVENGTSNAEAGKGPEGSATLRVKLSDGLKQPKHGGVPKILDTDMRRQGRYQALVDQDEQAGGSPQSKSSNDA
jgi:hypothetical protein